MMIDIIEDSILKRIKEVFTDFTVDSFPTDFEKYTYTSPQGCILTRFSSAKFPTQESIYRVNTPGFYNFTVYFSLRYIQKHNQAYNFLKLLKRVLNGFEILNKKLCVKQIDYEAVINGDVWYSFELTIDLPTIDENESTNQADQVLGMLFKEKKEIEAA